MRSIYLAAPFFNEKEIEVVTQLEGFLSDPGHITVFSPRKDGGNAALQGSLARDGEAIFRSNMAAMIRCQEMLAWIDRPQVGDAQIRRVKPGLLDNTWDVLSGPLEQTDLGVAWELGFVYAWRELGHCIAEHTDPAKQREIAGPRKIIAAFTLKPRGAGGLNLMLAECFDFIIHGYGELQDYLKLEYASEAMISMPQLSERWQGKKQ